MEETKTEPQKVYVVMRSFEYEGSILEAVFATEQAAYAWVAKQRRKSQLDVEEHEVWT